MMVVAEPLGVPDWQLALVARHTTNLVIIANARFEITWVNPPFEKLSGYTLDECCGRTPWELLSGSDTNPQIVQSIQRTLSAGQGFQGDILNYRRDKSSFWVRAAIDPVVDANGETVGFISVCTDISESKRLEELLRSREDRLAQLIHEREQRFEISESLARTLIDKAPVAIIVTDEKNTIRSFNAAAERLLGYSAEEMIGTSRQREFFSLEEMAEKARNCSHGGVSNAAELAKVRDFICGEEALVEEWSFRRKNGTTVPALVAISALRNSRNRKLGCAAIILDLTAQREAETARQEEARRLEKLSVHVPGVVYQFHRSPEGTYSLPFCSDSAKTMLGLEPDDLRENVFLFFDKILDEDRARVWESIGVSERSLDTWICEFRVIVDSGQVRWFLGRSTPELGSDGSILWSGLIIDVTEQKKIEQELLQESCHHKMLVDTATSFINLPLDEVEGAIQKSLKDLGEFVDADRSYVITYDFERATSTNTHEWCREGIEPFIEHLQNIPIDTIPEWTSVHCRGECIVIDDVLALPPGHTRDLLVPQGIKSIITIPMLKGCTCLGFVGFDAVRRHHRFSEKEQQLLTIFARMLASIKLRQNADEAVARSERRFQDVTAAAGGFVWEIGPDLRYSYLSDRAEEIMGRSVADILGQTLCQFLPDSDIQDFREKVQSAAAECRPLFNVQHRFALPNGELAFHSLNAIPTLDDKNSFCGFVGMTTDVTNETRAGLDLEAARREIEIFFDVSLNLMCVLDQDGRWVRVSRAWNDLLGCTVSELEKSRFIEFVHPEDIDRTMAAFHSLLNGVPVSGFVNRYRSADGMWREIEWHSRMVKGFIFNAARDVTDEKETERALASALSEERRTAEIKSRLVAVTSHEFRTPLASVRLAAESLIRHWDRLDENSVRSRIRTIVDTTDYLTNLVNDVLDLGSLASASSVEEAIDVELRVFLGDLCRSLLSSKSGESERIDLRFPDFPIILKTRPRLLRRAVVNLLENALKYSSKDQTVIVKLDLEGNEIVISFIDSGRGVPSGSELLLFESFFRAPNAVGTPGTGLGLAIVSEAMKHIGGRVTYHPRPEGGSIFSMYLSYEN